MQAVGLVFFFAVLVERLIEYFIAAPVDSFNWPKVWAATVLRGVAVLAGIGVSLVFNLNAFATLGIPTQYPIAAVIITGIVIAAGSNFVNDVFSTFAGGAVKITTATTIN